MKSQQQNLTFFYQLPKLRSIYKGEFNVINFSVNHLKWQVNHLKWQVNHLKWQLIMINFRFYCRYRWLIRVINRLMTLIVDSEERGTTLQKLIMDESESEVKWKWSEKWSGLWSIIFVIFTNVKERVLCNNNIGNKKCTTTFLWVLNLGQVGEIFKNFQKHPLGESFWKMVSKVIFWKNYKEISL